MREKLIELINEFFGCDAAYFDVNPFDLATHLLENGVIVPPCKVGNILYVISQTKDKRILPFINKYQATNIKVGKRKCLVYHEQNGYIKIFKQDDFGKTVFLTREAAEKALKRGRKHEFKSKVQLLFM